MKREKGFIYAQFPKALADIITYRHEVPRDTTEEDSFRAFVDLCNEVGATGYYRL